jgi:hypothetical protein
MGRWAETDPIGFDSGDYNLYRYVKNRFVVAIDPSGLVWLQSANLDKWRFGFTPFPIPMPGATNVCCCGAYRGEWNLNTHGPVKCKSSQGAFVQLIRVNKATSSTCYGSISMSNCIAYLELFPVDLDGMGNSIDNHPEDTFYHAFNLGDRVPTKGEWAMSAESGFFCNEDMNLDGFVEGFKGTDPCRSFSGYASYLPIKKENQIPAWFKKFSADKATSFQYGEAKWDCCGGTDYSS